VTVRVTVVSGLLGAGKTTFVRSHAAGLAGRVAVLVNDFGEAGIDGEILAGAGLETVELPSGCICCTLKGELVSTLERVVRRFDPEHLILEPSGVASPAGVLEALAAARLPVPTVVTLVDATEFAELHASGLYGRFLEEQVATADLVLVNKADLAPPSALAGTERLVGEIAPGALVLRTVRAGIDAAALPGPGGRRPPSAGEDHGFATFTLRPRGTVPHAAVAELFAGLAGGRYGPVVRAKGLVETDRGPRRLDLAAGRVDDAPFGRPVAVGRVVVIGRGLDREGLSRALDA